MSIKEARDKIELEMFKGGPHEKAIGAYIVEQLLKSEENAEKVMRPGKSLAGAVSSIRNKAQKAAVSGMAMIEEFEVYGWVREYYEISDLTVVEPAAQVPTAPPNDLANVDLFDLF